MSSAKTERLLNLVICLLSTRRPLTKAQIRQAVPQYAENTSDEAFDRMFERDKDELRELGIPLDTTSDDVLFEDEIGYRVDRDAYALPDVHLAPDELAVLGLASRVWQRASLAGPATRALAKLSALGAPPDERSMIGLEPRVRTAEPSFDALWAAVRDRVPVQFTYRTSGTGAVALRTVEPWAVTSWHGRWYLTGFDRDRQAPRVFRLTRVESDVRRVGTPGEYEVPSDHEPRVMVGDLSSDRPQRSATLLVRSGSGQTLRRRATSVTPSASPDGRDVLVLEFDDPEYFAQELVPYGPAALVADPPDLREAVVRRLEAVLSSAEASSVGERATGARR
jgi:proteasome accessory factor B